MLVSVIIPYYQDLTGLGQCLHFLRENEASFCAFAKDNEVSDFEVIVIDNGDSATISVDDFNWSRIKIFHEPIAGSYAARNKGIEVAEGEYYFFTDSDCRPEPDWLVNGLKAVNKEEKVIGGKISLKSDSSVHWSTLEKYEKAFFFQQAHYIKKECYAATANLVVSKKIMEKVGLFDASLRSGGDQDWGKRAHLLGVEFNYRDDVVVSHPTRKNLIKFIKRNIRVSAGNLYLFYRSQGLTWEFLWQKLRFLLNPNHFRSWNANWEYFDELSLYDQKKIKRYHYFFCWLEAVVLLIGKLSFKRLKKMTLIERS